MKKIIFITFVFVAVFFIYSLNAKEKIYYLSIGDHLSYGINNFNRVSNGYSNNIKNYYKNNLSNYVNYSNINDYRVNDLINDINYNKVIKYKNQELKLQNILVKSNLITLSIGMNEFINKKNINYDYVDEILKEIESLFEIMRKYNKDKIYFLGFYNVINNKRIIEYANKRVEKLCIKNEINYVNIDKLFNYIINGTYPTEDGYKYITDQVLSLLQSKIIV